MNNQKHLTLSDRIFIEQELLQGSSFKSIGAALHKDPTTISKEVMKHRISVQGRLLGGLCRKCKHSDSCKIRGGSPETNRCPYVNRCNRFCRKCYRQDPRDFCTLYIPFDCVPLKHAPHVCNACPKEKKCRFDHFLYHAIHAHREYEKVLSSAREGINMTPEELHELNEAHFSTCKERATTKSHTYAM